MPVIVATKGLRGRPPVGRDTVRRRAEAMMAALDVSDAELSVLLCDDGTIAELNESYRQKPGPTDVLSFSMDSDPAPAGRLLGDVVISLPRAAEQSEPGPAGLRREVTRLLAHGLLHLVGWTHETTKKRSAMERETDRLVEIAEAAVTGRRRSGASPSREAPPRR